MWARARCKSFVLVAATKWHDSRTSSCLSFESADLDTGATLAHCLCMLIKAEFNSITHQILSAAIEVHRILGPGLLESAYTPCPCSSWMLGIFGT